jgi:hypothetical protein
MFSESSKSELLGISARRASYGLIAAESADVGGEFFVHRLHSKNLRPQKE